MSMDNNTEVTPTPKGWSALSKNTKIVLVAVAVIIALAISGGSSSSNNTTSTTPDTSYTPTTISVSEQYSSWKSSFSPVFSTLITDYTQTTTDLGNGDMASSRIDFVSLSQDAIDISSYANSPDDNLNTIVAQLAVDLGILAGEGTQSLNNIDMGGSPTQGFYDACTSIGNDIAALNSALDTANATY